METNKVLPTIEVTILACEGKLIDNMGFFTHHVSNAKVFYLRENAEKAKDIFETRHNVKVDLYPVNIPTETVTIEIDEGSILNEK